jgi:hypothetical protein
MTFDAAEPALQKRCIRDIRPSNQGKDERLEYDPGSAGCLVGITGITVSHAFAVAGDPFGVNF